MAEPAWLDDYLGALGLGPRDVRSRPSDHDLLADLIGRHLAVFPFTSIGPRLGDDLPLDPDEVFERIVVRRRGGYCFEHNSLFFRVLGALGFERRLVLARVVIRTDDPPLDHRTTLVSLPDGDVLADVGFGWQTPHLPVPMSGAEVGSQWRRFRIAQVQPSRWELQLLGPDGWASRYRFDLHEYGDIDCAVGHFYCSRNPEMPFVNTLIASLLLDGEARSLRDDVYQVMTPDDTRAQEVSGADELRRILAEELGTRVTASEAATLWADVEAKRMAAGPA